VGEGRAQEQTEGDEEGKKQRKKRRKKDTNEGSKNEGKGRVMAQVVSRRPLTAEARVRARVIPCWDLWWTKWHWDRFLSEFFGFFPCQYHSTVAFQTHIIWGMRNMLT
jgi:hypothetical protein